MEPRPGCGYLRDAEIEAWVEGRLPASRQTAFLRHQEDGCGACSLLAADLATFGTLLRCGPLPAERAAFDRSRAIVAAHLRRDPAMERPSRGPARLFGPRAWRPLALVAAALVAVVLLAPDLLRGPTPGRFALPGGDEVRYVPATPEPSATVRGAAADGGFAEALAAWEAGDWTVAAERFEALRRRAPGYDVALHHGQAALMAGRWEAADGALAEAVRLGGELGADTSEASYALALAALGRHDLDTARARLARVVAEGGARTADAADLLTRLDPAR